MAGYTEAELRNLVRKIETSRLTMNGMPLMDGVRNAFRTKPFIYGTQGKKGGGLRMGGFIATAMNERDEKKRAKFKNTGQNMFSDDAHGYAFQTGARQGQQRAHNYQMMDMYYGDGKNIGTQADPFILEFVNYAAKLKDPPWQDAARPTHNPHQLSIGLRGGANKQKLFDDIPSQPFAPKPLARNPINFNAARDYMHPYAEFNKNSNEMGKWGKKGGWEPTAYTNNLYGVDSFRKLPQTMTKELSRIIRWSIQEFGGKIIFDGADVYYDQVFNKVVVDGQERFGDTELEASDLFQYFRPGQSTAAFGNGKIVFQWHGEEVVPSKMLFLTSWKWSAIAEKKWYQLMNPNNFQPQFGIFLKDTPLTRVSNVKRFFGVRPKETKPDVKQFVESYQVECKNIWNNFSTFPVGVTNENVAEWVNKNISSYYRVQELGLTNSGSDNIQTDWVGGAGDIQ